MIRGTIFGTRSLGTICESQIIGGLHHACSKSHQVCRLGRGIGTCRVDDGGRGSQHAVHPGRLQFHVGPSRRRREDRDGKECTRRPAGRSAAGHQGRPDGLWPSRGGGLQRCRDARRNWARAASGHQRKGPGDNTERKDADRLQPAAERGQLHRTGPLR